MEQSCKTAGIVRIELTVTDLAAAERFYVEGLGFALAGRADAEPAMTALLGAERISAVELRRGGQTVVLQAFRPQGDRYPPGAVSADQVFQHFAMPVADMADSFRRLQGTRPSLISDGPQQLPASSGGVVACKFRDPDGHPLELIEFPDRHEAGIDHSAIVVMDVERSIAFYRDRLGFHVASRQVNTGPEQDRLDGLSDVSVDVVALQPAAPTPHLELLGYRRPAVRPMPRLQPHDVAATRLVLEVGALPADAVRLADGRRVMLTHDPDGHALLLQSAVVDEAANNGAR